MRSLDNTNYAKSNFFFFSLPAVALLPYAICVRHREFKVPVRARECRDTAESHDFGISNFVYVFYIYVAFRRRGGNGAIQWREHSLLTGAR